MKNYKIKLLVLAVFSTLAAVAFSGCSDKNKSSESFDESLLKQPITFSYNKNGDDENELDNQDPTTSADESSDSEESAAESNDGSDSDNVEYIVVTDDEGQPVTTYVVVTDDAGNPVTDNSGETQTTAVQVTTAVKVNSGGSNSNETQTTTSSGNQNSGYVGRTDSVNAMWLDISEDKDFVFNDDFIEVKFKIKNSTPAGSYDITVSNPDFASLADNVKSVMPDTVLNGKVFVSQNAEAQKEVTDADGFTVYVDNVSAKPGEEVTVYFRMSNNPGMCAMNFWFDYDQNAMEIIECKASGEFGEIADLTEF